MDSTPAFDAANVHAAAAPIGATRMNSNARAHAIARRSGELTGVAALTPRERDVAQGMVRGRTNKVIARDLGVAPVTVCETAKRVARRLGAKSRLEAVVLICAELYATHARPGAPSLPEALEQALEA